MVVGNTVAYPPGDPTPFLSVGQTVKATYSYSNPTTGKLVTASKTFVVTHQIRIGLIGVSLR